jgi:hypothetical protein
VSGTTISAATHNTLASDISTEITNSLDRGGRGGMTAPLALSSGSSALPGLTFTGDADTGIYRGGADGVALVCGATEAQSWAATGATFPRGLTVTQSQTNTVGATITGNGSAAGLVVAGGSTGNAITATGGGTTAGATFANGTASTAATPRNAATLSNGNLSLAGVANPNMAVAHTNVLTPANLPKAWGQVQTDGVGGVGMNYGFNTSASVSISTSAIVITLAAPMASSAYLVLVNSMVGANFYVISAETISTTQFLITMHNPTSGALVDAATVPNILAFVVFGLQ